MDLQAFNAGCNVVGIAKNGIDYGMCCAWATMLDYDRLGMLLGAQSRTGAVLAPGDIVGVSALAEGQQAIAERLGKGHSDKTAKFVDVPHHREGSAILIDDARVRMVCEVYAVMRLPEIEADRFVILKVLSSRTSKARPFLSAYFD